MLALRGPNSVAVETKNVRTSTAKQQVSKREFFRLATLIAATLLACSGPLNAQSQSYNYTSTVYECSPNNSSYTVTERMSIDKPIYSEGDTVNGTFSSDYPTDKCPGTVGQQIMYGPTMGELSFTATQFEALESDTTGTHECGPISNPYFAYCTFFSSNPEAFGGTFTFTPTATGYPYQFFLTGERAGNSSGPYLTATVIPNSIVDLGPPSSKWSCDGVCGLPINLTNGNTYVQELDYAIPGLGGGVQLTRTWNSLWPSNSPWEEVGMFGDSWQSNFEEHIQVLQNSAKYWRGNGSAWTFTYNSGSQTYSLTSPTDDYATLAYDVSTTHFTVTLADGTQRVFSQPGYLLSIVDRNGNQANLTYDASTRITKVTDAVGRVLSFNYGNSTFPALVTSIQDSVGTVATYGYDSSGHLSVVTYADSSAINFTYDGSGLLLGTVDSQGKTLESHTYDSYRHGLTSQRANGVDYLSVTYNNGTATLADSLGNSTQYASGTRIAGRTYLTSISGSGCDSCAGRGNYTYTYDAYGNRSGSVDPLGHQTYYYIVRGNLQVLQRQMENSNWQTWNYAYNNFAEITTAIDPLGNSISNTYDSKGNLLTSTNPVASGVQWGTNGTSSFTYDVKGEPTSITDPNKNKTSIFYTSVGLVDHVTDAQRNTTYYQYDARGNRTAVIDANSQRTTFTYDSMNRLTQITYPTTPATSTIIGYDYRGRKASVTDPNGKSTQYAYDDADRLVTVTDGNYGTTHYAYDNESNLVSITDAASNHTIFHYDPYGHVASTSFPSTLGETYSYDVKGNLLTKTDRNGYTTNYTYDFLDRLIQKQYQDGSSVNYTYDQANRVTQIADATGTYGFSYDVMNRVTQASTAYSFIPGKTFTVQYGYDLNSNRTSMTDPQSAVTSYVLDGLNRVTTLTYPSRTSYTFTYDALSRRTQLGRPNGVNSNYQYDSLSRLLSVLHQTGSKGTTTLDGATYTYDAAGNRISRTDKRTGVTSTFSYDPLYELTQVLQGTNATESYTYDTVGNRLSSQGISPYNYNVSNELVSTPSSTYTYDNNGNMLTKTDSTGMTKYSWDFENRLTSIALPGSGGMISFKYDAFGRRIQKSGPSGTTTYVYDGESVLEEVDGAGNVVARYVQSPGVDQPLAETRGSTTSYYHADGLGAITSLSNSAAGLANTYTYDSYGNLSSSSGTVTNPLRYVGRDFDTETGLYYYRARYYDATIGRFLNEDPAKLGIGAKSLYAYVDNDPADFSDPFGLCKIDVNFKPLQGGYLHAYLLVSDPSGAQSVFRGEPENDTITPAEDAIEGWFFAKLGLNTTVHNLGNLNLQALPKGSAADNDSGASNQISRNALNNNCSCDAYNKQLRNSIAALNAAKIPYNPASTNSNAAANAMLQFLGLSISDVPTGAQGFYTDLFQFLPKTGGGSVF